MRSSRITGYQLMLATNSDFTKNKKVISYKGYKKKSTAFNNLTRNRTYYFKIRTYKTVNGTRYYSKWSKVKKIKTK